MNRVIVDFKKLTDEILNLLVEKYPDGYNDSDIITFRNASGELIEAVEVRTDETDYLVKVSIKLAESMENFMDDDEDDESEDDAVEINVPEEKEIDFSEVSDDDELEIDLDKEEDLDQDNIEN